MWRPRVDVPELTRCCFCLPLRYGLLGWGYFKLIGLLFAEVMLFQELAYIKSRNYASGLPPMLVTLISVIIVDLISTIISIVAGHMKHRLLYKVYYYYSVTFLIAFILVWTAIVIDEIIDLKRYGMDTYHFVIMYLVFNLFAAAPVVVVQIYVTLLVRSELRKLSNSDVQFVNNVAMFVGSDIASTP